MDPGEFDQRVELLERRETGRDGAGEPIIDLVEIARPWAKVTYPGGKEFLSNDGTDATRRAVFRLYARPVDVSMKLRLRGLEYDIQDVRPFDDVVEIHAVAKAPGAP
ncbi:phage head closure protein [Brevundimonas faecalis]|uniref:phage head closure protein n=1 Tax=Brevundimonas faecalis TaxID=947378 RepID=UPI00360D6599